MQGLHARRDTRRVTNGGRVYFFCYTRNSFVLSTASGGLWGLSKKIEQHAAGRVSMRPYVRVDGVEHLAEGCLAEE